MIIKKTISFLLCVSMLFCMLPANVFATTYSTSEYYYFEASDGYQMKVEKSNFASKVIDYSPGDPLPTDKANQTPGKALGVPDYISNSATPDVFVCLSNRGSLTLGFEKSFYDQEGEDLYVFEIGPAVEGMKVEVSNDLSAWYTVATLQGSSAGVDLQGKVPAGATFRYVRMTDDGTNTPYSGQFPGADIDAVCILPQESDVFTFTDNRGIVVQVNKDGAASEVIDFTAGDPWAAYGKNQIPERTLGLPNDRTGYESLALGKNGILVLKLNKPVINGDGLDLYIFEVGPRVEACEVEVSEDLQKWYYIGTAEGATSGLDLQGKVPLDKAYPYIRLTDTGNNLNTGEYPGVDLDAVCAVYTADSPAGTAPAVLTDISFSYKTSDGGYKSYSGLSFQDEWLMQDSYEYKHGLATMSLACCMAAMESAADNYTNSRKDANIRDLFGKLGFASTPEAGYVQYGYGASDDAKSGTIGMAVSRKDVNGTPCVAIVLRGGGYGSGGWAGDFDVSTSGSYHQGFYKAAVFARDRIRTYLKDSGLDASSCRFWITGFSRSAATANLLSILLRGIGCTDDNIYTYTFATPNNQIINNYEDRYSNIFNMINPLDIVPLVPLQQWGFSKQGTTYYFPGNDMSDLQYTHFTAAFKKLTSDGTYNSFYNHELVADAIVNMVAGCFDSRETYAFYLEQNMMRFMEGDDTAFDSVFCGVTTLNELKSLWKDKRFIKVASKCKEAIEVRKETHSQDDPYLKLLGIVRDLALQAAGKKVSAVVGVNVNLELEAFIRDLVANKRESRALMQHWPEAYMSWMLTCTEDDLRNVLPFRFNTIAVSCPVDVELYDAAGKLAAKTTTEMMEVADSDGTKETIAVSSVDSATKLDSFILGSSKYFVIPDGKEYKIGIRVNGSFEEGDTMTYCVTAYQGHQAQECITYDEIALSPDSVFTGTVAAPGRSVDNCTLTDGTGSALASSVKKYASKGLPFTDVPADAWYGKFLQNAYDSGIVGGMTATTYGPQNNLTHAQIMVMVANLHSKQKGDNFKSVSIAGDHWAASFRDYCKAEGIIDDRFDNRLNEPVNRGEMAYYFAHALTDSSYKNKKEAALSDISGNTYKNEILKLAKADIVGGYADGTFKADKLVTRAEASVFVSNILDAME